MSVAVAYLLVVLVYYLVLTEDSLRHCRRVCALVLTARQVVILINLYITRLPGNAGDAKRFYRKATGGFDWDQLVGTGFEFYSNFLAALFSVFGQSRELAFEVSFLAAGLVLIVLGRMIRYFGYEEKTWAVIALYGLSPSAACYTSSILREGWQELFLMLSCYGTIQLRQKFSLKTLVFLVISLILLGCLQKGLALYALLLCIVGFFYLTRRGQAQLPILLLSFMALFLGGYFRLIGAEEVELETSSRVVEAFTEGEIVEYALEYRGGLNEARANYADHLELETTAGLISAFPQLVLFYWFCPLPWQISESIDLISMFEIWGRTVLLAIGMLGLKNSDKEERSALTFLWTMFFVLEVMFAAGTGNWGTAARHRTVGLPLFCLLSISGVVRKKSKFGKTQSRPPTSAVAPSLSRREKIRRRRHGRLRTTSSEVKKREE